jgi:hypothetical protein
MVNLAYLVHVGYHLDRHVVMQAGADAMARTGCRARTLWATTGRRARTGRTDGRIRRWHKRVFGCGRKWQVRVCRRGRFGQVLVCGHGRYGGYSQAGADVIAKNTVNQKFDFDCVLTFLKGKKNILYSFIRFTCRLQHSFAK